MNVSEMINKLRIAMGDDVAPYVVSSQTLFQWLSDAYLRIQLEYDQWKFFHKRGRILTTQANVAEYSLPNVREISKDSVYRNKAGESTRLPLFYMEYETWVNEQQINLQRAGDPTFFIRLPSGKYRIEPVPTVAWEIRGDIWYKAAAFETLSDEPIWDEKYHNLLVWEALKVASLEWADNSKAPRMQANLSINLPPIRRAFNYEYLPIKGGARALL